MNQVTHPVSYTDISIFSPEISKFFYIKKYRYRLYFDTHFLILLTFIESLKIVLINMVRILMMSAKMATLGLRKIKVFWKEDYEVIIFVNDVTSKILSRDSNNIVDVVTWPKFGNSRISMTEVIITSSLKEFDQKKLFFWRAVLVQVQ